MTAETTSRAADPTARDFLRLLRSSGCFRLAVGGIIAAQAIWLSVVMGRGWYADGDLANVASANGQPFDWKYLSSSLGGDLGPPGRAVYWILNRLAPLDWGLTVGIRVLLQAIATLLLYRLLVLLVGRRTWLPIVLACYAFSAMLVPGIASLTSGISLVTAQVFVLLMLGAHVRYTRSGRFRTGISVGLYLFLAAVWDNGAVATVLMLPILSLGFLHGGSLSERVWASLRRRVGWLATGLALAVFAGLYRGNTFNSGSLHVNFGVLWTVARDEWLNVVGPSVVGGPWAWAPTGYVSSIQVSSPAALAGQAAIVILLTLALHRTGWRALVAWSLPLTTAVAGLAIVASGRYATYGSLITQFPRYSFQVPLALALGIALSFVSTTDELLRAPAREANVEPTRRTVENILASRWIALGAGVALVAASVWSTSGFARRYWQNPDRAFVTNMIASARAGGPDLNVYDSAVPVISIFEPHHFVSDILGLGGVRVRYDDPSSEPLVVNPTRGQFVPARFVPQTDVVGLMKPGCGSYLSGVGEWRLPFSQEVPKRDWFLRLESYHSRRTVLRVSLVDPSGSTLLPVSGSAVALSRPLEAVNLRLPDSAPRTLIIRSDDPGAMVCLVHGYLGYVVPKGPN